MAFHEVRADPSCLGMTKLVINTLPAYNWNKVHFSHYSFTIFPRILWFLYSYISEDFLLPRAHVLVVRYIFLVAPSFLSLPLLYRLFSLILSIVSFLYFSRSTIVFSRWSALWEIPAWVVELAPKGLTLSISGVRGFVASSGWEYREVTREYIISFSFFRAP